jgi:uncharacterized membrane protein
MSEQVPLNVPEQVILDPVEQKKIKIIELVRDNLDKIILAILIVFSYGAALIAVKIAATTAVVAFTTATVSNLVGALIALVTGKK